MVEALEPLYPRIEVPEDVRHERYSDEASGEPYRDLVTYETITDSLASYSILDSRIHQVDIDIIADEWDSTRVFLGKQNSERPYAALHWMLLKTHITVDASQERQLKEDLSERDRLLSRGSKPSKAQQKLHELTDEQTQKLELADEINKKITAAQDRVTKEASKGLDDLLDFLASLEGYIADECSETNIVRLFNSIDSKTGGRHRDLIVAKRTLIVMLANELSP